MKLRLVKWRKPYQLKSTQTKPVLLCPWSVTDPKTKEVKKRGMLSFTDIGSVQEVDDEVGYRILSEHSDILEIDEPKKPNGRGKAANA